MSTIERGSFGILSRISVVGLYDLEADVPNNEQSMPPSSCREDSQSCSSPENMQMTQKVDVESSKQVKIYDEALTDVKVLVSSVC